MVQTQTPAQKGFFFVLISLNLWSVPRLGKSPCALDDLCFPTGHFPEDFIELGPWILHLRNFYASESLSLFIANAHLIQLNFDLATLLFNIG